jgi:HlyD family secretion protein
MGGAGAIFMAAIILYAFQKPIVTWLGSRALVRWLCAPGKRKRLAVAVLVAVSAVLAVGFVPYPYHTGGPFVLLPSARVVVRAELEGLVEEVLVREGEWVQAGQPLARLSLRTYERNLEAARGQLEEARAQLLLVQAGAKPEEIERALTGVSTAQTALTWSKARAQRYSELYRQKMVSQQEFENALRQRDMDQQNVEEAQATLDVVRSGARQEQVEAMRAQIRSLQVMVDSYVADLDRTTVNSPIDGRVVTPRVQELAGSYLKPGQRDLVAEIEDDRTIRAEVEVPEEDADAVGVGAEVKVVAWSLHGTTFRGQVVEIAPVAATGTADAQSAVVGASDQGKPVSVTSNTDRSVRVVTEIPNPDHRLKSEMTGYAKIATGNRPLWDVLLRPLIRWCMVEVWYWIP